MPKRNPNAQGYKNTFENVKKEDDFLDISQITIFLSHSKWDIWGKKIRRIQWWGLKISRQQSFAQDVSFSAFLTLQTHFWTLRSGFSSKWPGNFFVALFKSFLPRGIRKFHLEGDAQKKMKTAEWWFGAEIQNMCKSGREVSEKLYTSWYKSKNRLAQASEV